MAEKVTQPTIAVVSLKVIRANGAVEDHGVVAYDGDTQTRAYIEAERAAGRTVTRAQVGADTQEGH